MGCRPPASLRGGATPEQDLSTSTPISPGSLASASTATIHGRAGIPCRRVAGCSSAQGTKANGVPDRIYGAGSVPDWQTQLCQIGSKVRRMLAAKTKRRRLSMTADRGSISRTCNGSEACRSDWDRCQMWGRGKNRNYGFVIVHYSSPVGFSGLSSLISRLRCPFRAAPSGCKRQWVGIG
ncbi:hypothetical protein N657DRAFT_260900 [Parathielavia appendiculata]|uniref:Uncharacterized protein n=1 Tax=Parathielavia appendiculata TaxID=2587402 RepID=A0AAN6TRE1_9PEZI|nr:hypothetical protein N657DRAFT_260900 [Parathielavia appendiculata]